MRVYWWVWMVVRFVCVIRVPVCARVSGVSRRPPVSFYRYCDSCVYPVCAPAGVLNR